MKVATLKRLKAIEERLLPVGGGAEVRSNSARAVDKLLKAEAEKRNDENED